MNRGVLVTLAIAVAAAAGFFVQRQLQPANVAAAPPAAAADTSATATAAEQAPAQKIPEVLPRFQLADRDGKMRSLQDWSGHPLMVNFWATWCGPCRKEIPLLNQIRKQHGVQGLEIVGIALDFREDVLKYIKETVITYPILIGEEDVLAAMEALGMKDSPLPFTFFADSKQRIVAMKLGELHQDEADLILEKLVAVDTGKLDLKIAQKEISEGMKAIDTRRAVEKAAKTP